MNFKISLVALAAIATLGAGMHANTQPATMSFFVTSVGVGKGADLGGLAGADAHCQALATKVGAGGKTWRAYLSTQGDGAVNARDRIGAGPWVNAKGVVIAKSVDDLHGPGNNIAKATALTELAAIVNGRGDTPNTHDVLTGSTPEGRAFPAGTDMSCKSWTSGTTGSAMVGHSDRTGLDESAPAKSWNSSHPSRGPGGGCTQDDLKSTGGAGLYYCMATN